MAIWRRVVTAVSIAAMLAGCSNSAGGEPDDAPPSTEEKTSSKPSGPLRVDGGVAAPGSLSEFTCEADEEGMWRASGTVTNTESRAEDYRLTIVVAPTDARRSKAREVTLTDIPSGESKAFATKRLPVADGEEPICSVQAARLS